MNVLQFNGKSDWCRWADEQCIPANCNYAICVNRRILPGGLCGETIKRKTVTKEPEEEFIPSVKVKGKVFRKIGEKEIF
jgi:hypothetical protein